MDLTNNIERVLGILADFAVQEFRLVWGLETDLKSLETSLSSISAVLLDAQEQRTTNRKLSLWLRQLKHVLYDAEEVLDDFAYQVLRKKVVNNAHNGINSKVRRLISTSNPMVYRLRIGQKVNSIRKRLDEINYNKNEFNLSKKDGHGRVQIKKREMTHSFVNASDIIGRDGDRETIVQFLMKSHGRDENVSVIPIVGIGGLGKTALAKLVYNDQRVVDRFYPMVWVCLGDVKEFNVNQVMANIVKSLSGDKSVDSSNPQQLQNIIRDKLLNKRFLLILDDMWNANRDKWLELKALFIGGAEGSKIVVTTRISSVASCVGTTSAHNLEGLPHDECVSLFKKLAFSSEAEVDQDLMKIGDEIVRKCKGVPLVVRTLGSLLFSKPNEREWLFVRDSGIWQMEGSQSDILHILKYSYDQLSSDLKQCFVYCSIFPEDHEFDDISLVSFWMAHGLLQSPKRKQGLNEIPTLQPEYVGKQYVRELLSRGFFQDLKEQEYLCTFKMHDLVHELACSIGGDEFAIVNVHDKNIGENVRHVWFDVQNFSANSSNAVQTVLVPKYGFWTTITFPEACIAKFKHLKVLALTESMFEELPKSIGTLKHLRSLDLTYGKRLKKLPNSICKLHNLQTLLLRGCMMLQELPKRIGELINLRWLEITTQQKHLPENGIESLTSLQFLGFYHCRNLEILMKGTRLLLGTLIVVDCASLVSLFHLSTDVMKCYLPVLEVLCISDCENLDLDSLELQLPSLRYLAIAELAQLEDTWPQWIQRCASTLQYLDIYNCWFLAALPDWLPGFASLRTLSIKLCPKLASLPRGMERLTALKEFKIKGCGELSKRCDEKRGGEDWPMIAHVPNIVLES